MRYLLIGNAPDRADAVRRAAERADIVVQIDECRYAELLPKMRAHYVFLSNSGSSPAAWASIMERRAALERAPVFQSPTRLVLARNPAFYAIKRFFLRAEANGLWPTFRTNPLPTALSRRFPTGPVSFGSSIRLETKLHKLGMPRSSMPSTGMVAYDWLRRRWNESDYINAEGVSFDEWQIHPSTIEQALIKPLEEKRAWHPAAPTLHW